MDVVHRADGGAAVQVLESGVVVYSASALGACTRSLAAARQGLEGWKGDNPAVIQAVFDKGHEAEKQAIRAYEEGEWIVLNKQLEVTLPLTSKLFVVGHIDFTVQRQEGESKAIFVVDAKRQNDAEWVKRTIEQSMFWHHYSWQFSVYMLATGMHMMVARMNDAGKLKTNFIAEPPKTKTQILRRVLEVEKMAARDLMGEECDRNDYPCPYFHRLHTKKEDDTPVREVEDVELGDLALHYQRLTKEIAPVHALEKRQKEIKAALIKKAGEGKVRETISGIVVKVTKSPVAQRVTPPGTMVRVSVELPGTEEKNE